MTAPLPAEDQAAPPDIVRAACAELIVTDLGSARRFWVDLLGLLVTAEAEGALYLRGCEELTHHNLVLRQGPRAALARLGFRVRGAADVDRAESYFRRLGCATERVPAGETLGLGEAVRVEDPLGFVAEYFHHVEHPQRTAQSYQLRHGAEPTRLDHFNLATPDVAAAVGLYAGLGFGLSETIEDGPTLYGAWMYRKQTVHDVAFTAATGPRLHHLGFFSHESAQVLRICDILGSLHEESRIERGPGRHGVSNACYVYLRDPDGHRVEIYTSDYYTGDPDHPTLRWDVSDPRRRNFWGGPVAESWYADASPVLDLRGGVQPQVELRPAPEAEVSADPGRGHPAPA